VAARLLQFRVRASPMVIDGCHLLSDVCCEVSATSWSLVQGSATECGMSECDHEASTLKRPRPTKAVEPWKGVEGGNSGGLSSSRVWFYMLVLVITVLIIVFFWGGGRRSQNNTTAYIFLWQDWWKFEGCGTETKVCLERHRLRGVICRLLEDVSPSVSSCSQ